MVTMSVLSANMRQKRPFATTSRTRDASMNTRNSTSNNRVCSTDWIRYLAACGGGVYFLQLGFFVWGVAADGRQDDLFLVRHPFCSSVARIPATQDSGVCQLCLSLHRYSFPSF